MAEKNQQQQLEKSHQELSAERQSSQFLNQQVAVLEDKLERAQKDLSQADNKITTLRQEKMFLVQEKAQLDGALKQLQLMNSSSGKNNVV
jgi:chromosome segregation ATPase